MLPSNITQKKQKIIKKGKSSYSSKAYNNPFFSKKKKARNRTFKIELNWKAKLFALLVIALIAALVWLFFYSRFFSIQVITVNGGGRVEESSVRKIIAEQSTSNFLVLFPQKNLWLFSSDRLRAKLEEKYAFNELSIKKKWPNELVVIYDEKDYALVWEEDNKFYFADITGFIIEEANLLDIKDKDYPIFANRSMNKISSRQAGVDEGLIAYGMELYRYILPYDAEFKVARIIIDHELNTIKLSLVEGPEIYFNTEEAIERQVEKLLTVKKREKIANDFFKKTYIDVRFGNSVYYR